MAVAVDRAPSLDFGSQEASRLLDPRSRGDRLMAAITALIQLKNVGEDTRTVASTYLSPDVVMHADAAHAFWTQDKVGVDAFLAALQQNGTMYAFTRHLIATALAPEGDWAFAWWVDQDLRVNSEAQGDIPQSDQSCNVLGLWAAKGDDAGRITDLWFFRQLTLPERALRFNDPAMPFQSLDTAAFKEPSELKEDPARARAMMDAARQFDGMYAAGNTVAAAELLADNVVSYDLLFGSSSNSREEWVAKHDKLFAGQKYDQELHTATIAASAHSNKAFIHWECAGPMGTLGGMNVLVFDVDSLKVTHVIGFRTPGPDEASAVLKGVPIDEHGLN